MGKINFLEYLKDNTVLFDGAMGTMLYSKGIFINRCFDEVNLSNPELVKEIHSEYIKAGADAIETNTFSANRYKLAKFGLVDKLYEINKRGAEIAKEVAQDDTWIAGSIGPLGVKIEPIGPTPIDEAKDAFKEQIKALIDGGVDLLIFETFYDVNEILQAISIAKDLTDIPIIAQMTVNEDGNTHYGTPSEVFTKKLEEAGADVIGINCSVGPQPMLEVVKRMLKVTKKPISVQPNAGVPRNVDGRNIYLVSPEYMAEYAKRYVNMGAKIVGGCCGTTPQHIKEMRKAIHSLIPRKRFVEITEVKKEIARLKPVPLEQRSNFAKKLKQGEFVTSVEMVPPKGINSEKEIEKAKRLKEAGVDAINIPDGPRALARMGASYLAKILQDEAGIETILHYTCRDKNLLGIMSDLLGLHSIGIRNLLIITGDPPKMGDYPDATAVFDVDSIGLVNIAKNLNMGIDIGGNFIGSQTEYFIGVGVNPGAVGLDYELERFGWKIKAGAEFAITQPVFDLDTFYNFYKRIENYKIPIIAGVWPLVSYKNAEFLNNEIPGITIPDDIMKRMKNAETKEEALEIGLQEAIKIIKNIREIVHGVQISMPFGRVEIPIRILEEII
ncbi:MAG: bifunctional homocysteine S-methyltransferase/methylenetetrahydrofolate reductase [Candidatus Marinimicrobia bacterium]|nr:bifunctional homocysteine S-methyltransferase/methylenetetrahydrofolate reductase [Candidatus Neomarinimicrobiota bacterium]